MLIRVLDRHLPNRVRRGDPLFPLCIAIVAAGVIQTIGGLVLILTH